MRHFRDVSLSKRLLIYITLLIVVTISVVGVPGYIIAKKELDTKGRTILESSVKLAVEYAKTQYHFYDSGEKTYGEALEDIRTYLDGPMLADGTRELDAPVELGEHGYFIIYGMDGMAILHPNLEGENLYDVTDPIDGSYLVREQIEAALTGDGYHEYNWLYVGSDEVGEKITYCEYLEDWDFIIVATTYKTDFNKGATTILTIVLFVSLFSIFIGVVGAIMFISSITRPVGNVLIGMKRAESGEFIKVNPLKRQDEIGQLIDGFNQMSEAIDLANANLKKQADHISYLAYNDIISELPNRNRFMDYIDSRITADAENGYLLQMDIKDFKIINSSIGSDLGDRVLKQIGKAFLTIKDEKSMIARTSGNEFSIWFENIDEDQLEKQIDQFNYVLKEQLADAQIFHNIEFHYAYSTYPLHGKNFEVLYRYASIAMKYAKENRDLKLYEFHNSMLEVIENDLKMSKLLEYAIFNQEISVAYQNKVSLHDEKVIGAEALARWHSSSLGFVSPDVFIPAINRSNLTITFGQYMLEQVFFEFPYLQKKLGEDIKVSINISPIFFLDARFVEILKHGLNKFSIPPEVIMLEITEDIFIDDLESIQNIVGEIRELGCGISLDDFGTGYSSLNYLRKIRVNEVKIDKSFIDRMHSDEKTYVMLEAIRKLTSAYGYDLVAEGVEAEYQIDLLRKIGYDIVQGYYYSKPEPVQYD